MIAVILAGGQGTRLWPLSRRANPKQFHALLSEKAMLVEAYERLLPLLTAEQVFVSVVPEFVNQVKALLPDVPEENYLIEPARRDSGPAMAFAAKQLQARGLGDEPVIFIPTDHAIADAETFVRAVRVGEALVRETGSLLDIAITPEFAATNLGYTRIGDKHSETDGVEVYRFRGHKEKPDQKTAEGYLESGEYLWHANYYFWTPDRMLQAYKTHAPAVYDVMKDWSGTAADLEAFKALTPISIDVAVTERLSPEDVLIIKGDFGWSDVGAFHVLAKQLDDQADSEGNVVRGKGVTLDATDCYVHGGAGKLIAAYGVSDLVIVDTPDALLVCHKDKAADIKKLTELLAAGGDESYL